MVRRTSEIVLFDVDDYECLFAKYGINGFWSEENLAQHQKVKEAIIANGIPLPAWFDSLSSIGAQRANINHRRMSNNSMAFEKQPSAEYLHLIFQLIQLDGEPGFVNLEEMGRRRPNAQGLNPCAEILLDSKQQCNLTTINMAAFLMENGKLDLDGLMEAQELSTRAGLRMALVDLELPEWDKIHKRDRLTGCSLTGVQDAFAHMTKDEQANVLSTLNSIANEVAEEYSYALRIPIPLLVTTVKPEGTLSLVAGGVSPGVHDSHSPYFIRRIRISSNDALAKAAIAHGWTISPEIGTPGNTLENARIYVIDFPIKSEATKTKNDVGALEQLDRYFAFQLHYTNHNTSNTITVRPEEWLPLEKEIYRKWDDFVGVSFLSHDGGTYQLAPYEAITKEQYEELASQYVPFDPDILQLYETVGASELDADDPDCATGACPVR